MFTHFQGREVPVQRGQIEGEHDQFGIQPDVFVNGKVAVLTDADLKTAPLQKLRQAKNVHRIRVNHQDGRDDVRGGHGSLHRIDGHEGCAGSGSKSLRRTVPR